MDSLKESAVGVPGGATYSGEDAMNSQVYTFDAMICKVPDIDGAYVEFPCGYR